jgi:SP family arabinose:H+ symporter-like MFS transporter
MRIPETASALRYVAFAAGVASIGGFLFGYDTAVINGANTYLKAHFHLDAAQEGMAGASAILGCIPGAMLAGPLSDRLGRKRLLFFCAVAYAVSGVLSGLPRTFTGFLAARFLSGLGIGASSMICPVYIAEIAPGRWRGRLGTLFQLGIVTGIFLTLFVNRLVQRLGDDSWNAATGWRWMVGLEAVPAIAFLALLFAVPESPRWLAQHGRAGEALGVLGRAGGADHAAREMEAIQLALSHEEGGWGELVRGPFRRPLLIAIVLMACSQFCGINAIMYYSTKIFALSGGSRDAAFSSSVWVGLINLLFTFVAIGFVDRLGRRPLLIAGTAIQALSLGMVGWVFHAHQQGMLLLACVIGFIAAFAMAMGPISWLLCSEIFPNRVRGRAMSVAAFTVWVSCYLVAQTFPMLNDSPAVGPALTFWLYALVSLFSLAFAALVVPETKGRTLEAIEEHWIEKQHGGAA